MSRVVDILKSIQNKETYNKDALSRAEEILKAICNNTSITMTARSRYEALLLCLKNKTKTTITPRTRLEEILVAVINGTIDSWITGKNIIDINNYYINKNEEIKIIDNKIYAKNVTNAVFIKVDLETNKNYTVSYFMECTINEPSTGKWRFLYEDGTYSAIGLSGSSTLVDRKTKYLLLYTNSGTENDAVISNIKLEQGSTATPYSPYCFLSELEEEYYKTFGV